ncbi:MAG: type I glyceraldehyde-3-phosphate dehydrogenase [Halanaerobiales bacterium]|nr:type I glyceraldehyde-3-phosphate dehydrogenase [Halanaerobiales bacterium]
MDKVRIGISGMGRIGRQVLRMAVNNSSIEVVVINDIGKMIAIEHLVKYDSVHGKANFDVSHTIDSLIINGQEVKYTSEPNPEELCWGKEDVDIVIESTGLFTSFVDATKHLSAGAGHVLVTGPSKDIKMIVLGVNESDYHIDEDFIISLASCTTNCLAPIVKALNNYYGIEHAFMTTIHSYTNDQRILDVYHPDLRRARAGAINMIPTSTGAAKAIGKIIPSLEGKIDGMSVRVPIMDVSLIDLVVKLKVRKVTPTEINNKLVLAKMDIGLDILDVNWDPLTSSDYIGNTHSAIIDALSTQVLNNNFVKILAWYDNEIAYSQRVIDMILKIGGR